MMEKTNTPVPVNSKPEVRRNSVAAKLLRPLVPLAAGLMLTYNVSYAQDKPHKNIRQMVEDAISIPTQNDLEETNAIAKGILNQNSTNVKVIKPVENKAIQPKNDTKVILPPVGANAQAGEMLKQGANGVTKDNAQAKMDEIKSLYNNASLNPTLKPELLKLFKDIQKIKLGIPAEPTKEVKPDVKSEVKEEVTQEVQPSEVKKDSVEVEQPKIIIKTQQDLGNEQNGNSAPVSSIAKADELLNQGTAGVTKDNAQAKMDEIKKLYIDPAITPAQKEALGKLFNEIKAIKLGKPIAPKIETKTNVKTDSATVANPAPVITNTVQAKDSSANVPKSEVKADTKQLNAADGKSLEERIAGAATPDDIVGIKADIKAQYTNALSQKNEAECKRLKGLWDNAILKENEIGNKR